MNWNVIKIYKILADELNVSEGIGFDDPEIIEEFKYGENEFGDDNKTTKKDKEKKIPINPNELETV